MEDLPQYNQRSGRIDRVKSQEKARQLEILKACFIHLDIALPNERSYPSDLPREYVEAITLAMGRYKADDKPALVNQLAVQEEFIADLEKREKEYADWRYKELMECSLKIRDRIKQDIYLVDVIVPKS